jgi:hypothetical protein
MLLFISKIFTLKTNFGVNVLFNTEKLLYIVEECIKHKVNETFIIHTFDNNDFKTSCLNMLSVHSALK